MTRISFFSAFLHVMVMTLVASSSPCAEDSRPSPSPDAKPASPAARAHDQRAIARGATTFETYCATCHGKTGVGDGPLASQLKFAPADLTQIARRNGGRFPFDQVAKSIDGREPVKGHGGAGMPVWGDAFLDSREGFSAAKVKDKIKELTQYLASLQE